MALQGKISGLSHGILWGWAYDPENLQRRLVVEIVGDDYPLAVGVAQIWIEELAEIGDGCYGFCLSLPVEKLRYVGRLRARLANGEDWLEGVIYPSGKPMPSLPPLLGQVANRNGLRLSGWALHPASPSEAVELEIYEGHRLLGRVLADQNTEELADLGRDSRYRGFEFTLPFEFADGKCHEIKVLDRHGQSLQASPLQVICYPSAIDTYLATLPGNGADVDYFRVLARQFQDYQDYLPASVDFSAYADWARCFADRAISQASEPAQPFLLLVFGNGDLNATLTSLLGQSHQVFSVLVRGECGIADPRIVYVDPGEWLSRVEQSLKTHRGLLGFVQAGDTLANHALSAFALAFEDPLVRMAYSDCDFCGSDGRPVRAWFKPDWDYDLFLAQQLTHHGFMVRSEILPLDSPWLASPEAWPWLAVAEIGDDGRAICHIDRVLYHRKLDNDFPELEKIIEQLLPKIDPRLKIKETLADGSLRSIEWPHPETWPTVSLIVPTRDHKALLAKCVDSLLKTDYPRLEIIVVDNDSQQPATLDYLQSLESGAVKVIRYPHRFNYSRINNLAVEQAEGGIVGLINDDVEAMDGQWLKAMVTHLLRPNVGAVGAKLLWRNGMVQHAGVLLGMNGIAGHIGNDWEESDLGYFGYNQVARKVSAVTAACLICRKSDYLALGGLDEQAFPVAFNDVDFCMRLVEAGKYILWTPEAKLWHAESASRGRDDLPEKLARLEKEKTEFKRRWGEKLYFDPYYNINLNLDRFSHKGLAFPPRKKA